jgi:hypothetical protein
MLEILLIIAISKKIAAMMTEKGRSAAGYVVAFVLLWIGGEIAGAFLGIIVVVIRDPAGLNDGFNFIAYVFALAGAAAGGAIGYLIASAVPAGEPIDDPIKRKLAAFDDDDEYDEHDDDRDRGRRRRRVSGDGSFEDSSGRK